MHRRIPLLSSLRDVFSLLWPTKSAGHTLYAKMPNEKDLAAGLEQQYQRHKAQFVIGRKTTEEFMAGLSQFVDLVPADLSAVSKDVLGHCQYNISHHEDAIGKPLTYQLYSVLFNEKSEPYYHDKDLQDWADGFVWLFLETTTGIFQTNSAALSWDIHVYRGISPADIQARNSTFKGYLHLFMLHDDCR